MCDVLLIEYLCEGEVVFKRYQTIRLAYIVRPCLCGRKMYLLGQAYFSKFLLELHKPRSVRTVAICGMNDAVISKLAEEHGVEIVVITEDEMGTIEF